MNNNKNFLYTVVVSKKHSGTHVKEIIFFRPKGITTDQIEVALRLAI